MQGTQVKVETTNDQGVTMLANVKTPIDEFLAAIVAADMGACRAWGESVALDATVPNWRFSRFGAQAVRQEYQRWFAHPAKFEALRRLPIDGGEVVEYTINWEEGGVPHSGHHLHILRVADDVIVADTVMCGGRWPASLLADMEAADHG